MDNAGGDLLYFTNATEDFHKCWAACNITVYTASA